ncbi:hypothetical protein JHK87_019741 [Glycine soja]|nr:hypothetical protein JHK87_019741 [Glycine soja]
MSNATYYIFHNGNLSSCPNNPFLPLFTVVFFILPIEKDPATFSTQLPSTWGTACITCTNHTLKTGCTNNTCGVDPFNPLGEFFVSGDVDEDIYLVLRPLYTCHASFLHVLGLMAFSKTSPRSRKGSWALQGLLFPYQHNSHFVYLQLQSITIFDDDPSSEYFIDDKSIKVDGKIVNLNTCLLSIDKQGNGGSKLSTVVPYTKLHTLI